MSNPYGAEESNPYGSLETSYTDGAERLDAGESVNTYGGYGSYTPELDSASSEGKGQDGESKDEETSNMYGAIDEEAETAQDNVYGGSEDNVYGGSDDVDGGDSNVYGGASEMGDAAYPDIGITANDASVYGGYGEDSGQAGDDIAGDQKTTTTTTTDTDDADKGDDKNAADSQTQEEDEEPEGVFGYRRSDLPLERREWNEEYQTLIDSYHESVERARYSDAGYAALQRIINKKGEGDKEQSPSSQQQPTEEESKEGGYDERSPLAVGMRIQRLVGEFERRARLFAKIIIAESDRLAHFLAANPDGTPPPRLIPPLSVGGIAGGEKFIAGGIFLKRVFNTKDLYGSEDGAMKSANHELRGLKSLVGIHPKLRTALMCIVNYRGFRVIAACELPVGKGSLAYGSCDAGRTVECDPEIHKVMLEVGQKLQLKPHKVGRSRKSPTELLGPCDIEVHKGTDGRWYILDTARLFPPAEPDHYLYCQHIGAQGQMLVSAGRVAPKQWKRALCEKLIRGGAGGSLAYPFMGSNPPLEGHENGAFVSTPWRWDPKKPVPREVVDHYMPLVRVTTVPGYADSFLVYLAYKPVAKEQHQHHKWVSEGRLKRLSQSRNTYGQDKLPRGEPAFYGGQFQNSLGMVEQFIDGVPALAGAVMPDGRESSNESTALMNIRSEDYHKTKYYRAHYDNEESIFWGNVDSRVVNERAMRLFLPMINTDDLVRYSIYKQRKRAGLSVDPKDEERYGSEEKVLDIEPVAGGFSGNLDYKQLAKAIESGEDATSTLPLIVGCCIFVTRIRGQHLHSMLRPEFVAQYRTPLSSDAFTGFGWHKAAVHNQEVRVATRELAGKYMRDFMLDLEFAGGVTTGEELTEKCHERGVNMRYLATVRRCSLSPRMRGIVMEEMVLRTLKTHFRRILRSVNAPSEDSYREIVRAYFNIVVGKSYVSEFFWSMTLPLAMLSKFGSVLDGDDTVFRFGQAMSFRLFTEPFSILQSLQRRLGVSFPSTLNAVAMSNLLSLDVIYPLGRPGVQMKAKGFHTLKQGERKRLQLGRRVSNRVMRVVQPSLDSEDAMRVYKEWDSFLRNAKYTISDALLPVVKATSKCFGWRPKDIGELLVIDEMMHRLQSSQLNQRIALDRHSFITQTFGESSTYGIFNHMAIAERYLQEFSSEFHGKWNEHIAQKESGVTEEDESCGEFRSKWSLNTIFLVDRSVPPRMWPLHSKLFRYLLGFETGRITTSDVPTVVAEQPALSPPINSTGIRSVAALRKHLESMARVTSDNLTAGQLGISSHKNMLNESDRKAAHELYQSTAEMKEEKLKPGLPLPAPLDMRFWWNRYTSPALLRAWWHVDRATTLVRESGRMHPGFFNMSLYLLRGRVYMCMGRYEDALSAIRQAYVDCQLVYGRASQNKAAAAAQTIHLSSLRGHPLLWLLVNMTGHANVGHVYQRSQLRRRRGSSALLADFEKEGVSVDEFKQNHALAWKYLVKPEVSDEVMDMWTCSVQEQVSIMHALCLKNGAKDLPELNFKLEKGVPAIEPNLEWEPTANEKYLSVAAALHFLFVDVSGISTSWPLPPYFECLQRIMGHRMPIVTAYLSHGLKQAPSVGLRAGWYAISAFQEVLRKGVKEQSEWVQRVFDAKVTLNADVTGRCNEAHNYKAGESVELRYLGYEMIRQFKRMLDADDLRRHIAAFIAVTDVQLLHKNSRLLEFTPKSMDVLATALRRLGLQTEFEGQEDALSEKHIEHLDQLDWSSFRGLRTIFDVEMRRVIVWFVAIQRILEVNSVVTWANSDLFQSSDEDILGADDDANTDGAESKEEAEEASEKQSPGESKQLVIPPHVLWDEERFGRFYSWTQWPVGTWLWKKVSVVTTTTSVFTMTHYSLDVITDAFDNEEKYPYLPDTCKNRTNIAWGQKMLMSHDSDDSKESCNTTAPIITRHVCDGGAQDAGADPGFVCADDKVNCDDVKITVVEATDEFGKTVQIPTVPASAPLAYRKVFECEFQNQTYKAFMRFRRQELKQAHAHTIMSYRTYVPTADHVAGIEIELQPDVDGKPVVVTYDSEDVCRCFTTGLIMDITTENRTANGHFTTSTMRQQLTSLSTEIKWSGDEKKKPALCSVTNTTMSSAGAGSTSDMNGARSFVIPSLSVYNENVFRMQQCNTETRDEIVAWGVCPKDVAARFIGCTGNSDGSLVDADGETIDIYNLEDTGERPPFYPLNYD